MHFPKLLVVTEFPPNAPTLNIQALKGFPADRIHWWSCEREYTSVYGQKYARMYRCWLPYRLIARRRVPRLRSMIVEKLWVPYAARHLRSTLAEAKPDQLWLNLYGWPIAAICRSGIVGRVRSHATIWDFPDVKADQSRWGEARCRRMLAQALSVYKAATTCDAISQPMREELTIQTGRSDIAILHSGLEDADVARLKLEPEPSDGIIRIAHAGTILAPDAFALFVNTLRQAAGKTGRRICLEFFGGQSHARNSWFDPEWMQNDGALEEPVFIERLQRCTWGLVALDVDDANPRYSRFSFPNKFGTYLAAGLPIMLLSGPESSSAKMLLQQPVGIRLDHNRLLLDLLDTLKMENPKRTFLAAIEGCAKTEFYMPAIRQKLWQNLGVRCAD